ncbi:hypothetical protein [Pseudomonas sp. P5_A2_2]
MNTNESYSYADARRGLWRAHRDASPATGASQRARHFGEAMRLLEDGRWQQAFTRLAELADAGHPVAARIALLLVRRGTRLFGGSFRASAQQLASWQRAND